MIRTLVHKSEQCWIITAVSKHCWNNTTKSRKASCALRRIAPRSAYHNNNYLPLLWSIHRQHRTALFRLLQLLDIRSATQDTSILDAIHLVVEYQNSRKDFLADEINLDLRKDCLARAIARAAMSPRMSHRWRGFVQTRYEGQTVLKRRELEIAVLYRKENLFALSENSSSYLPMAITSF